MAYYNTKFRALALLSSRKAAQSVFHLFCTPYSGKPRRKAPPVFEQANKLHFDFNGLSVHGWKWVPDQPNSRKILIVHGFDSCSYRFDRYMVPLTRAGFEVFAFDAPGHGTSDGKTINALDYSRVILKAETLFGPFFSIMAHSLGGLSTALAFEQLPHQEQRKLVLIAPTTETSSAIDNFFRFVSVPKKVRTDFEHLLVEVGKQPIDFYSVKRAIQRIHAPVLWIHDEEDKVCPFCDILPVQQLQLPNVEFFITKGLGHSGVYRQNNVFKKIMSFLSPGGGGMQAH
ncbi:MAG: hypothetical protein K0Q66_531 [Chitinophagaceae bacterium]|nr:hypothetical protein [Chitinophagaceae bacterium]